MKTNDVYTDYEGFGYFPDQQHEEAYQASEADTSLYHYVFHYNAFTRLWSAIPRDVYQQYWNDATVSGVIRSKSIETLTEIIYKTKGDPELIEKLIK
jgi:hypothetical protein